MAITFVSGAGVENGSSGNALGVTVPGGGFPAGSLVVAGVMALGAELGTGFTDTAGNTYTKIGSITRTGSDIFCALYASIIANALSAGNSITYSYGTNIAGRGVQACCHTSTVGWASLPPAANLIETDEEASGTSFTSIDPFTGVTDAGVGVYTAAKTAAFSATPGTGWTNVYSFGVVAPALENHMARQTRSAGAGNYSVGWQSWPATANGVIVGAHFNEAGGSPPATPKGLAALGVG